ncbi:hypothetical protein [Rhizobium sp. HT1-10]
MAKVTLINAVWVSIMCVILTWAAILYGEKLPIKRGAGPSPVAMLD